MSRPLASLVALLLPASALAEDPPAAPPAPPVEVDLPAPAKASDPPGIVKMKVGEKRRFTVGAVKRATIDKPEVLALGALAADAFEVRALALGEAVVFAWDGDGVLRNYTIRVVDPKVERERARWLRGEWPGEEARITKEFLDASVFQALSDIAFDAGWRLVFATKPTDSVSLSFRDLPADDALLQVLQASGLAASRRGKVVTIAEAR